MFLDVLEVPYLHSHDPAAGRWLHHTSHHVGIYDLPIPYGIRARHVFARTRGGLLGGVEFCLCPVSYLVDL